MGRKFYQNKWWLLFLLLFLMTCDDNPSKPKLTGLIDPSFQYISGNWTPHYIKMSMNDIWQEAGIAREGCNYYFLPKPISPFKCSGRFIPASDFFQCWFGIYTISDNQNGIYGLESDEINELEIVRLAIIDQIAWLKNFAGIDTPHVFLDSTTEITTEKTIIDSREGWKISGRLVSNIDVGENNPAYVADLLRIPRECWVDSVQSYQRVILDVTAYCWYAPENKEMNVAYYNGVEYQSFSGITYKTIEKIREELEAMVRGISVCE